MTLNVESPRVYTRHGVPISVTGIAQVRLTPCQAGNFHQSVLLNSVDQQTHVHVK